MLPVDDPDVMTVSLNGWHEAELRAELQCPGIREHPNQHGGRCAKVGERREVVLTDLVRVAPLLEHRRYLCDHDGIGNGDVAGAYALHLTWRHPYEGRIRRRRRSCISSLLH